MSRDDNRNGVPDLRLGKQGAEERFRDFVRPLEKIGNEELVLPLESGLNGEWVKVAEDRLVTRSDG